nr:hypothetical protein Itr_chr14CG10090 [Ipomoea trifida]
MYIKNNKLSGFHWVSTPVETRELESIESVDSLVFDRNQRLSGFRSESRLSDDRKPEMISDWFLIGKRVSYGFRWRGLLEDDESPGNLAPGLDFLWNLKGEVEGLLPNATGGSDGALTTVGPQFCDDA